MRRIRAGVITAAIGFGASFILTVLAMDKIDLLPFVTPFFITFLVGLGVIINGFFFTLPRKRLPGDVQDAMSQNMLDATLNRGALYEAPAPAPANLTNELAPSVRPQPVSVSEHTTHHLNTGKR